MTGGSGFIGRHLLPLLGDHEVLCLGHGGAASGTNPQVRVIAGDLRVPNSYSQELESFKPDCCVHLAWHGLPDYSFQRCRENLIAGLDLFEVLGRIGCGTIFSAGTCWEYGNIGGQVREDEPGRDLGLFAAFKSALHTMGRSIVMPQGTRLIWGRIFFVYGPGQRATSLIPSCHKALSKERVAPRVSNPQAVNDFVHVDDVCAAIKLLAEEKDASGTYNIGSGGPVAVWHVVNLVAESLGLAPVYGDLPEEPGGFWADTARIGALGWKPRITLAAGISQTVAALEASR